MKYTLIISR